MGAAGILGSDRFPEPPLLPKLPEARRCMNYKIKETSFVAFSLSVPVHYQPCQFVVLGSTGSCGNYIYYCVVALNHTVDFIYFGFVSFLSFSMKFEATCLVFSRICLFMNCPNFSFKELLGHMLSNHNHDIVDPCKECTIQLEPEFSTRCVSIVCAVKTRDEGQLIISALFY